MQQDKFLNKDKTQAILDTRPAGVPINEALNALAKQGYTIEGYNDVSLGEKAINVVGDVAKAAASDLVVRPVSRTTEAVTRTLFPDSMAAKGYESYADENKPVQTGVFGIEAPQPGTGTQAIRNIAGETAQTAAYLIPYGKVAGGIAGATGSKFLGQLGAGSAGGYLADVGMGLQDEQQTVKEALTPGIGTAIGAAIPTGFAGAQVAGRALQKTGAGLAGSVLPVNEREAGIIKSYLADKPFMQRVADVLKGTDSSPVTSGSTAVGQSLFGTKKMIGVQAERAQKTLWNDLIKPQLDNAKVQIDLPEYFNTVEKKIIEDTPELTRQKALLEALNSFKEDYAGMNTISLAKLQKLKEGWAEFVPEKFYKGQNIAGNARQVSALLADEARKTIYDVLGPEVKQAYFDYGNLMNLSKMGQTAMTGQKLKGGTGGLVSELISKAVTPVGTVGGNVIYKVGQGLEFIGKAGAKTLDEVLGLNNNQVLNNPINQQTTQSTANATKNVIMKDTIPQSTKGASGKVTDINVYKKAFLDSASADAFPDIAQKVKDAKTVEEVISAVSEGGNTSMSAYVSKLNDTIKNMDKSTTGKMSGFAQITKDIPEELQPLAEEARTTKIYHGTSLENANKIKKEGFKVGMGKGISGEPSKDFIFASGNKSGASSYVNDRLGIKNPTVVEGNFTGKVLEIKSKMSDTEAFGEASKMLGVSLKIGPSGKPTILDIEAIKKAMKEQGYGAIKFKDMYANGKEAYAILPENIKK